MKHVANIFDQLGYQRVNGSHEDWDILWSHNYPFTESIITRDLLPHQRVNHFPGSGYITNKVSLATTPGLKYVPRAFELPNEKQAFLEHVR